MKKWAKIAESGGKDLISLGKEILFMGFSVDLDVHCSASTREIVVGHTEAGPGEQSRNLRYNGRFLRTLCCVDRCSTGILLHEHFLRRLVEGIVVGKVGVEHGFHVAKAAMYCDDSTTIFIWSGIMTENKSCSNASRETLPVAGTPALSREFLRPGEVDAAGAMADEKSEVDVRIRGNCYSRRAN